MIGRPCTCVFRESSLGSACTKPCIYDWAAMYICVRGSACTKPGIYDWAVMYICVRGSACTKPGMYDWAAMYICVRGSACTKSGIYDWAAMYICVRGIKFGEVPVRSLVYMIDGHVHMCSGNQVWGSACTMAGIYVCAAMYICVRGIKFSSVSMIFRVNFLTALTVWYFYSYYICIETCDVIVPDKDGDESNSHLR